MVMEMDIDHIIAAYAAMLTTYSIVRTIQGKRRRLKFTHEVRIEQEDSYILLLHITNISTSTIVITECGFKSSYAKFNSRLLNTSVEILPRTCHSEEYKLLQIEDDASILKKYYAYDTFRKEYTQPLIMPIENSRKVKAMSDALNKISAINEKTSHDLNRAFEKFNVSDNARKKLAKEDLKKAIKEKNGRK